MAALNLSVGTWPQEMMQSAWDGAMSLLAQLWYIPAAFIVIFILGAVLAAVIGAIPRKG